MAKRKKLTAEDPFARANAIADASDLRYEQQIEELRLIGATVSVPEDISRSLSYGLMSPATSTKEANFGVLPKLAERFVKIFNDVPTDKHRKTMMIRALGIPLVDKAGQGQDYLGYKESGSFPAAVLDKQRNLSALFSAMNLPCEAEEKLQAMLADVVKVKPAAEIAAPEQAAEINTPAPAPV